MLDNYFNTIINFSLYPILKLILNLISQIEISL